MRFHVIVRFLFLVALLDLSSVRMSFAISGGEPDVMNRYSFTVLLAIQTKDGGRVECSGSLVDDRTVLTAAHCLLSGKGRGLVRVPDEPQNTCQHSYRGLARIEDAACSNATDQAVARSVNIYALRGHGGTLPADRVLINAEYLEGLSKGLPPQQLGRVDLAVLKFTQSIKDVLPDSGVVDLPITMAEDAASPNFRRPDGQVDWAAAFAQFNTARFISLIRQKAATFKQKPVAGLVAGFGYANCSHTAQCTDLEVDRWTIDKVLYVYDGTRCRPEADVAAILQASQICFLNTAATTEGATNTYVYGLDTYRPQSNVIYDSREGDSGGPVTFVWDYGGPYVDGGSYVLIASTSWGDADQGVNTGLLSNLAFLRNALLETDQGYVKVSLDTTIAAARNIGPFAGRWELESLSGARVTLDPELGQNFSTILLDDYVADLQIGCWAVEHTFSRDESSISIAADTYRRWPICGRGDVDPNVALMKRLDAVLRGGAASIDGDHMLVSGPGGASATLRLQPTLQRQLDADGVEMDESDARNFVELYWWHWSLTNDLALQYMARAYAPTINFYDRARSANSVLAEKASFAQRWPGRVYSIRSDSLSVRCGTPAYWGICTADGIVEWHATSAARGATSNGSASFHFELQRKGPNSSLIAAESGKVISH